MRTDAQRLPARRPVSLDDFFRTVRESFLRAEEAVGGSLVRSFRIGGHDVALRFAGASLEPVLTPALRHLAVQTTSSPALTICLFDSVSTGSEPPVPPWSSTDYIARGDIQGGSDGRFVAGYNLGTGVLSLLDTERNLAVYWVRSALSIPYWETGAPLRTLLHWWMRQHGRQLVHAAAVGTEAGAVLLAGKGGSGKSTSALACLAAGMRYLGDDYVLLSDRPPEVHSLYNSAKLDPAQMRQFPQLLPAVANAARLATEKALAFVHETFPNHLVRRLPVRAILVPRITGKAETQIVAASPASALRALAPSTIFQLAGAGEEEFRALSAFVRHAPCFTLELGTDLSQIADVIGGVLGGR
jgi:hypothetical protein